MTLETLGMSVAEGKAILHGIQDFVAAQQVIEDLEHKRVCATCSRVAVRMLVKSSHSF